MKSTLSYSINLKNLPLGKHHFTFDIGDDFFALFEGSEVQKGRLIVTVEVDKKQTFSELLIFIKGSVTTECDRCLDEMDIPVDNKSVAIAKFITQGQKDNIDDEGIIWVDAMENNINLAQFLFDAIILSLPLQRVHAEGECNKEMTAKLASLQIN